MLGLSKLAKTKWVKEFESLSPENKERIYAQKYKERTIKPLGEGSSRVSDLVVNPEHGLAVRKINQAVAPNSLLFGENLWKTLHKNVKQLEAEKHLRDIASNEGDFAHVISGGPTKAYYQYSPGGNPKIKDLEARRKAYMDRRAKLKNTQARFVPTDLFNEGLALNREFHTEALLSPAGEKIWNEFKRRYPGAWDKRDMNIAGGKLVDFEPFESTNTHFLYGVKAKPNQVRKLFLGEGNLEKAIQQGSNLTDEQKQKLFKYIAKPNVVESFVPGSAPLKKTFMGKIRNIINMFRH